MHNLLVKLVKYNKKNKIKQNQAWKTRRKKESKIQHRHDKKTRVSLMTCEGTHQNEKNVDTAIAGDCKGNLPIYIIFFYFSFV